MCLVNTSLSIPVERPAPRIYDFLCQPENLSRWASDWVGEPAQGPVTWSFSERNRFGVLDFAVRRPDGAALYVPLRVAAHGNGCTVFVTLFRPAGKSDAEFAAVVERAQRDLAQAKRLLEAD
jgi:hypothetical protein